MNSTPGTTTDISTAPGWHGRQRLVHDDGATMYANMTASRLCADPAAAHDSIGRAMRSLGLFPRRAANRPRLKLAGVTTVVRVAIADDDPLARLAIEAMVRRADGLMFVGAARGVHEIVKVAMLTGAEAVVLDWMMPDGGGAEAARRILTRRPDTAIVALTASRSQEAAREMEDAGAFGVLAKGGSVHELAHTIHRAMSGA
jgi:CheY-like chemotaxis protein